MATYQTRAARNQSVLYGMSSCTGIVSGATAWAISVAFKATARPA